MHHLHQDIIPTNEYVKVLFEKAYLICPTNKGQQVSNADLSTLKLKIYTLLS